MSIVRDRQIDIKKEQERIEEQALEFDDSEHETACKTTLAAK